MNDHDVDDDGDVGKLSLEVAGRSESVILLQSKVLFYKHELTKFN